MRDTLEMMKTIITGKEKDANEKELISDYKNNLSPNILAYMYISNFGIINQISNHWLKLDSADKASFCLQELDKCLLTFDLSKDNKFITYFKTCYNNRLRTETQYLEFSNARKTMLYNNELFEQDILINDLDIEDIELLLNEYKLNDEEKEYCRLLNLGYSIKEISMILNRKLITVYMKLNIIKNKIAVENSY